MQVVHCFVLTCLVLLSVPSAVCAQAESVDLEVREAEPPEDGLEEPGAEDVTHLRAPEGRHFLDRYADALAGTWAAALVAGGAGALLGTGLSMGLACGHNDPEVEGDGVACAIVTFLGSSIGTGGGWLLGVGIGATMGAGLDFGEGLAALGLGFLTACAPLAASLTAGLLTDELTLGLASGGTVFGVGLALMTPFFATLFAHDRAASAEPAAVHAFLAPSPTGLSLIVGGEL